MSHMHSTKEAKTAIRQLHAIIDGGLTDQFISLNTQGSTLCEPDVWDGPLAQQFRQSVWPQTETAPEKVGHEPESVCSQPDHIHHNKFTAGGGS